jgi:mono/diheme cytochrome c family protein
MKKHTSILYVTLFIITCIAFTPGKKFQTPWPVPDEYKKKVNPMKGDTMATATGKTLYTLHCKSCHGIKGKGDGPKAAQLDTECGDFSTASFQVQTDGTLFYKTIEGRKDMPPFKIKIPEQNDIWAIINYMRTLK